MNSLVIGANGFLGARLVDRLKRCGNYVEQVDYVQDKGGNRSLDFAKLSGLADDYDSVFLLASYIPYGSMNTANLQMTELNVVLPLKVVSRFTRAVLLFTSSISVYGKMDKVIDEKSPFNAPEMYGQSKICGEFIARSAAQHRIIRFSSLYGRGMYGGTFIPRIISDAKEKKEIVLYGDGSRKQNYIHVDDAAEMCISAVVNGKNEAYLGAYVRSYSNAEVAQEVGKHFSGCKIVFKGEDNTCSTEIDNRHTLSAIGYTPGIDLGAGIKELVGNV